MYEIAHPRKPGRQGDRDRARSRSGYLSRIVQNFDDSGLITRKPLPSDRRQYQLSLTAKGARPSTSSIAVHMTMSQHCSLACRTAAANAVDRGDGRDRKPARQPPAQLLRLLSCAEPRPGDMGWVVQSHGSLYAREYGFDSSFESLVAEISAKFLASFDASRERCWIAELDGAPVGSVFLVRHSDDVAKLRLLLVDPAGRGHGLGQRLVAECMSFARQCGYRKITLWTQSILVAARRIYQDAGFWRAGWHRAAPQFRPKPDRRDLVARTAGACLNRTRRNDASHADAPFAFGRRKCSSSRGMISTKLQGLVR